MLAVQNLNETNDDSPQTFNGPKLVNNGKGVKRPKVLNLLNAGNQKRTKTLKKMKSSIIQDDEERFKDEFLSMSDNPDDSPGNERMFDDTMITKKTFTHLPNEMKPANRRQKQSIISVSDVLGFEKR